MHQGRFTLNRLWRIAQSKMNGSNNQKQTLLRFSPDGKKIGHLPAQKSIDYDYHWLLLHFNASPLKERVRTPTWEEVTQTFIAKPPTKQLYKQHAFLPTSPEKGSLPALQKQVSARCKAQHIGVRGSYSPKLDVFAASGKHDRRESTVKKKALCEERLPQLTRPTKMDQSSSVVSLPSVFKERPPIDASSMEELDEFWSSIA